MAAIDFPSSPVNNQVFGLYKYNSAIGAWLVNASPLTTLGTVTVGTWNASPIAIAYGGTGATDVAGARANLGLAGLSGIQTFTGSQTFIPSDSGVVPLTVRGLIGQSTALTQWVSPTGGSVLAEVDQYGGVKGIYAQFSSDSATTTPLTVKAFTGQSANIQNWKNVGGTDVAFVSSNGSITANTFMATANGAGTSFRVGDDAWIGDIDVANAIGIRGVSTPANGYIIFGNGNTASLGRAGTGPLNYTGPFAVNSTTTLGQLTVIPQAVSTTVAVIRGMVSQTADLQQWQNGAGSTLGGISNLGQTYLGTTNPETLGFGGQSVTAITGNGTTVTVTYQNAMTLAVGQWISISNVTPTGFNGTYKIASIISSTQLTYANTTSGSGTGGYVSFGSANLTVAPLNIHSVGIAVKGLSGQSAPLQSWVKGNGFTAAEVKADGSFYVDNQLDATTFQGSSMTLYGGSLSLTGATSNIINLSSTGLGAPTLTAYSAGTKIVLWNSITASNVGYALGIESNNMWFSVDTTGQGYKWYGGTTLAASLTGAGALTLVGDITVSGGDIFTAAATNSGLFSDTTTGNVTLGGALTTGTFTAGATGSTGAVSLFPATGAQNITLGGATTGTITLGSTLATAVQLPTGKTKVGTTTLVQGGAVSITLPTLAGTLYASGNTDVALLDGGTNASLTATAGGIVYSTSTAMAITPVGTAKQVITSNAANAPTWQTLDLTYMPEAAFKKSVLCASTADIDASLSTATTLTGYSAGGISYSCTTTAGSATVNLASGTTAGLKVGATVTVNASFPSVVTVATIVSATQFTVSSGTGIVAGTAVATTFTNTIAALTMDGITPALNDRVLIKNQTKVGGITVTANRDNGIYYLSTLGSASVPWVLTRVTDGDTSSEIAGATVNIDDGTAQGSQLWSNNFKSTDTLGTTAMVWNRLLNDGDWTTAATASKAVLRGTSGQVTATNYFTTVTTLASDTIALTFSTNAGIQYRTGVAGAITFTGASYTAGSSIAVFITNGATLQTVTFPAGWIFVGAKPTNLAASKSAVLTVTSLGTTEAACIASWAVQT